MNPKEKIAEQILKKMETPWTKPGPEWCMALQGNHDEHQCHKKPGHVRDPGISNAYHECYCGVWW